MDQSLIQGTESWKNLRKSKITGTDSYKIMGLCPYGESPYSLWLSKLGFGKEVIETEAMRKGKEIEPLARDIFYKETGFITVPEVVFSKEHDFLMASLDGIDMDKQVILEIKKVKSEYHQMALSGIVPEPFRIQMLHQMICVGIKKSFYLSLGYDLSYKILEVYLDEAEAKTLIEKEKEFYTCLTEYVAPPFTEKDYINRTDQEWIEKAGRLKATMEKRKEIELEEETLKNELIALAGGSNTAGGNLKLSKVVRRGLPKYKEIPELQNVNLDLHRGPNTTYFRFS